MLYLTCQSPDCEPVASSHILERWVHPNWRRFSGGWSQASERHKVPLERKVGTFLLRGGASAEVKSGRAEVLRSTETNLCIDWSNCAAALQRYLCVCVRACVRKHFTDVTITSWMSVCSWNICPSPSTCRTQILQVSCDTARLPLSRLKVQCRGL